MQQRHGDRFGAELDQFANEFSRAALVERFDDLAARAHAFRHTARERQIGKRVGFDHDHPARQRTRRLRARYVQDLLKVLGDQKADLGALLLQDDVGWHRRAMQQRLNIGGRNAGLRKQLLDAGKDGDGLVLGGRWRLHQTDIARAFVEKQQVGECSADVDAETTTHGDSSLR